MPITSTLAARLAKRGIQIQKPTEEIFAEDKGILDEFGSRLAADWDKCWDKSWECFYYWNINTRKVSWLPPDDPDCIITDPEKKDDEIKTIARPDQTRPDIDSRTRTDRSRKRRDEPRDRSPKRSLPPPKSRKRRDEDDDSFDPMDPSTYSDAPKGGWSRGIPKPGEAIRTEGVPQVEL